MRFEAFVFMIGERTNGDVRVHMRILGHEISDNGYGLIFLIIDAEENLIVGIVLDEGGLQVLVKVRVKAFQRS